MIDFSNLKRCLDSILNETLTPSVDCLVYQDHRPIFRYFSGYSDIEAEKAIDGNELYFIFSMTKMVTCTAALQLFEQDQFSMDDELSRYIPSFAKMKILDPTTQDGYAQNPIRIVDLFTMRGGLDYNLESDGIKKALAEGKTSTRELVDAMSDKILGFEPGTRFRYSLCHDVLGALIEIWSGKKLSVYMDEMIFRPLGMNRTFFRSPIDSEVKAQLAARYTSDENGQLKKISLECPYNLSPEYQSGGAGLISCTEDYALFLDALACGGIGKTGNRILKESTVELMKTNQLQGEALDDFHQLRDGYGYGLGVRTHLDPDESGSLSPIGEFGWDGAAGAFSMVDTEHKLSLTYFQHCHKWDKSIQSQMRNALYSCLNT